MTAAHESPVLNSGERRSLLMLGKSMRWLTVLFLSATALQAQKGDALIPSLGFPHALAISCDGVHLPPGTFLMRVEVTAHDCDFVGVAGLPPGWRSLYAYDSKVGFRVALHPAPGARLEQRRAIASLFDHVVLVYPTDHDDVWVPPTVTLAFEYWDPKSGSVTVKITNFAIAGKELKPSQSSEPTATGVTPPGTGDRAAGRRGSP
jgi:hypothetical protein